MLSSKELSRSSNEELGLQTPPRFYSGLGFTHDPREGNRDPLIMETIRAIE